MRLDGLARADVALSYSGTAQAGHLAGFVAHIVAHRYGHGHDMPMSTPSQRQRLREKANEVIKGLRAKYPGYDAIGPKEIAVEINERTTARQASPKSVANALRSGRIHNGDHGRIDHLSKTIWSVPIEAAAISIAEIVGGETLTDFGLDDLRKWHVVSVSLAPIEIRGVATDIIMLAYDPERSVDPDQWDDARIVPFLNAIANELDMLAGLVEVTNNRITFRQAVGLPTDNETD
jgi:hypothetical protein